MDEKLRNRFMDMVIYAEKAVEFLGDLNHQELVRDERTYFAIIRAIEVVGESAAQVGREQLQNYEGVPWNNIIAMRNILIHQYSGISSETIFDTVTDFLPQFIQHIKSLLEASK